MFLLEVSPGYTTIEKEFEASLGRAFVEGKADYIILDDKRKLFLIECGMYGIQQGWLNEEFMELDDQSSEIRLRLTRKGKEHFGLLVKEVEDRLDRKGF